MWYTRYAYTFILEKKINEKTLKWKMRNGPSYGTTSTTETKIVKKVNKKIKKKNESKNNDDQQRGT